MRKRKGAPEGAEQQPERKRGRLTSRYGRPPVRAFSASDTDLNLCLMSIDYTVRQYRPVLRVFGVTDKGHSIGLHIPGFLPYFYVLSKPWLTHGSQALRDFTEQLERDLVARTDPNRMSGRGGGRGSKDAFGPAGIRRVISVEAVQRTSMYGYSPDGPSTFLKITLAAPSLFYACRSLLQTAPGVVLPIAPSNGVGKPVDTEHVFATLYEASLIFPLRFMIDRQIVGGQWLTLPHGSYDVQYQGGESMTSNAWPPVESKAGSSSSANTNPKPTPRTLSTQLEVWVRSYTDLVVRPIEGEWARLPPRRVLSFDIECKGESGHFPKAQSNPVVTIANVLSDHDGRGGVPSDHAVVFGLGTHAKLTVHPEGVHTIDMYSATDEPRLLTTQQEFVQDADPDIVQSFNGNKFDHPYVLDRGAALGIGRTVSQLGRVLGEETRYVKRKIHTKAQGERETVEVLMTGRLQLDVMQLLISEYKFRSYTLNACSAELLDGMTKDDVHHSIIERLSNGSAEDRARLARYCLKDALLPEWIMRKTGKLNKVFALSRVTGVPQSIILEKGQQIRGRSCLLRRANPRGFIMPRIERGQTPQDDDDKYAGATVIEITPGLVTDPVSTLDFNSLYPSLMMVNNLCSSTWCATKEVIDRMRPEDVRVFDNDGHTDVFVREHVQVGVACQTVRDTVSARKRTQAAMGEAEARGDKFAKDCLDSQQDAEKLTGNSIYGAMGAKTAEMPCQAVARTVTGEGRRRLLKVIKWVTEHFTIANGYPCNAEVLGGDTDSIFVRWPGQTVAKGIELGNEAAALVNRKNAEEGCVGLVIEQETVFTRSIFFAKKRYAGLVIKLKDLKNLVVHSVEFMKKLAELLKKPSVKKRGLASVRRDSFPLCSTMVDKCIDLLLRVADIKQAIVQSATYAKEQIERLWQGMADWSELLMTINVSKEVYKGNPLVAVYRKKLQERDPEAAPRLGERREYVVVEAVKGTTKGAKAEDPVYAMEHGLRLDTAWYVDYLKAPLTQIFELLVPPPQYQSVPGLTPIQVPPQEWHKSGFQRVSELFTGDHTRTVRRPTAQTPKTLPANGAGGILRFVQKARRCVVCNCSLVDAASPDSRGGLGGRRGPMALCAGCESKRPVEIENAARTLSALQAENKAIWDGCTKCCDGMADVALICRNMQCKQFFRRRKVKDDVANMAAKLVALELKEHSPEPPVGAVASAVESSSSSGVVPMDCSSGSSNSSSTVMTD